MLLSKQGQEIEVNGKTLYVGQRIIANNVCAEYEGLIGYIKEIRTDADKDTGNEFDDIYVSFEKPRDSERIKRLEEAFSALYDEPKNIDEITLDNVILAPDMLESNPSIKQLADYAANWKKLLGEHRSRLVEDYDPRDSHEVNVTGEQLLVLTEIAMLLDKMRVNDDKGKQRYYKIPVVWSMWGKLEVAASSIDEAIEIALKSETPLPKGFYVDDSIEFDDLSGVEELEYCEEDVE